VSCVEREQVCSLFLWFKSLINYGMICGVGTQTKEIKMNLKTGLFLSTAVFAFADGFTHAFADEAEATRLEKLFQSYLSDTKAVVAVKTDGDGYAVNFDLAPLMGQSGAIVKITPMQFKMASQGDGKWQIAQDQPMALTMDMKGQGILEEKIASVKLTGIFDEKLNSFSKLSGEANDITVSEKITDPATGGGDVSATIKSMKFDQTGVAGANGGVDITGKYTLDGLTENINIAGKPETGAPPMNLVINAANGSYDMTGKGMKAKPLLDLMAFAVAHQTKELVSKDQAKLKTIMKDGLPIFENVTANGKFNSLTVASQFGQFGVDSVEISGDMNGIIKDGKLREKMAFNGLTLPPALVPPWATKLVPKNFSVDFTVSGFDLASPAQMILDQIDFTKEPPLPDGFEKVLIPIFMPKGTVDVSLNPSTIDNETYSVKLEGSIAAGPAALPSGKAKVSAKGIDELMKIIQEAPPEAGLAQGAALVLVAKGMAKAEADGSLTWNIESTPDGKVLVNGIDPTKLK
jgi:hypothetical protein